jgi:hypothetical protein
VTPPKAAAPEPLPPELVDRLACLFEEFQLQELVEAFEIAREAGRGFAQVTVTFTNYSSVDIDARFTRKPRPRYSDWTKPR